MKARETKMKNDTLNVFRDLPKGDNICLSIPEISDMDEFLSSVKDSLEFHYPWVEAPNDEEKYNKYIKRINFESHVSFFIKRLEDAKIVGVININEIVMGVFQSGYLGFYAFRKFSGQGLMSEGLSLALYFYFEKLKLHRIEANIQPENIKSIELIKSKHFRREGFSSNYLKINGEWRDHERFAMTLEDYRELT
jgi:[ribosomal protein S5]-alanine N-acetyltransferase